MYQIYSIQYITLLIFFIVPNWKKTASWQAWLFLGSQCTDQWLCKAPYEDEDHLYRCPHESGQQWLIHFSTSIRYFGKKLNSCPGLPELIVDGLTSWVEEKPLPSSRTHFSAKSEDTPIHGVPTLTPILLPACLSLTRSSVSRHCTSIPHPHTKSHTPIFRIHNTYSTYYIPYIHNRQVRHRSGPYEYLILSIIIMAVMMRLRGCPSSFLWRRG